MVLSSLINVAQSAFIKGRNISDNVLMAEEHFRGYARETEVPKCTLKIYLYKAFDSISWEFLMCALQKIHFPTTYINWIYACISTPMYSIKVNGILKGFSQERRVLDKETLCFSISSPMA